MTGLGLGQTGLWVWAWVTGLSQTGLWVWAWVTGLGQIDLWVWAWVTGLSQTGLWVWAWVTGLGQIDLWVMGQIGLVGTGDCGGGWVQVCSWRLKPESLLVPQALRAAAEHRSRQKKSLLAMVVFAVGCFWRLLYSTQFSWVASRRFRRENQEEIGSVAMAVVALALLVCHAECQPNLNIS